MFKSILKMAMVAVVLITSVIVNLEARGGGGSSFGYGMLGGMVGGTLTGAMMNAGNNSQPQTVVYQPAPQPQYQAPQYDAETERLRLENENLRLKLQQQELAEQPARKRQRTSNIINTREISE